MQYAKQAVGLAILAYAAWLYWPNVKGWLGGIKWPFSGKTESPAIDDAADFAALKRLRDRFERLGCKDGMTAINTATAHFWHTEGHS